MRLGTTALLVGICSVSALRAGPPDDVSRFFPADTEMVVYVNVRQLVGSALVKKHALDPVKSILKSNKESKQALETVGLDPFRDIHTLYLVGPASSAPRLLLVAKGSFDVERLQAAADREVKKYPDKRKLHQEGDLRVYEIAENGRTAWATVLDKETVLVGLTRETLFEAARSTECKIKNAQVQALLREQDSKQSIWVVTLATDDLKKQIGSNAQTAALAEKLDCVTGRILVTDAIHMDVQARTADARAARELGKFLDELKAVAVFATQNVDTYGPLISRLLDTFEVHTDKNTVTLSSTITEEVIERGLKKDK